MVATTPRPDDCVSGWALNEADRKLAASTSPSPPYWGNLARAASWSTCFLIIDEPSVKIDSNLQEHVVFFA
jgi:hypothetical protein